MLEVKGFFFYRVDEHLPTDYYEIDLWGPKAMKGTVGQKLIDELNHQTVTM